MCRGALGGCDHRAMTADPAPTDPAATTRAAAVARYFDGFRRGDHPAILSCLTDDVFWDLPGQAHL